MPLETQTLFAIVAGAFSGAAAVLMFVDRRDRGIEERINARVQKEVAELRGRVEKLEQSQAQALRHIFASLRFAAALPDTEALITELELAAEALN